MLISLKAGGVGINLTAASNVFIMVILPFHTSRFSCMTVKFFLFPCTLFLEEIFHAVGGSPEFTKEKFIPVFFSRNFWPYNTNKVRP